MYGILNKVSFNNSLKIINFIIKEFIQLFYLKFSIAIMTTLR